MSELTIQLADKEGLAWAQAQVIAHHYLHHPVDTRCSPLAYLVLLDGERVGCLIFGRPESTRCNGWYGSVEDITRAKSDPRYCRITRWQVLNLARVWLHPSIQQGGSHYVQNAATQVIAQALRRVCYDYLIAKPPVWCEEPYEILECMSYCQSTIHRGTLYRASNFKLMRTNERGIETYARSLRRLSHAEHAVIRQRSAEDKRAQKLRRERNYQQLSLLEQGA